MDHAKLPFWPRLLSRPLAAAYCGISPDTFDRLVEGRVLPQSVRLPGVRRTLWDRGQMDEALDLLVGARAYEDRAQSREARKAAWQARHAGSRQRERGRQ